VNRRTIYFTGPRSLELREERLPALTADELLVHTQISAISAGTEMLVFRGEFPEGIEDKDDAVSSSMRYPIAYGYASVGRVIQIGNAVDREWEDRLVFGFQAHSSHFVARPDALLPVPPEIVQEDAVFLPNMETAINLVQDAAPILGERGLVLGQGVVGLLSSALLHEFPLECLVVADRYELRRNASQNIGVSAALDPGMPNFREAALARTGSSGTGYDWTVELTGNPAALDDAIALTTYSGRVLVGSWFGNKNVPINLGGRYHRSRIQMIASQVSTVSPELTGRWDKGRRFQVAWTALGRIQPGRWITQRFPVDRAPAAYRLLDESPESTIQVIFTY
jgi:2-desacetyl-2-hydroxyethyl bacteriochlorophyllide A dehydrogenase